MSTNVNLGGAKQRESGLELMRILAMLVIVAHHYVVNSGIFPLVNHPGPFSLNDYFLMLFGWGGKTGIDCFLLITGYFMCKQEATVKKFIKLMSWWYFYNVVFAFIFSVTGYTTLSLKSIVGLLIPFRDLSSNSFTSCFMVWYLFIPFLNKLIHALNEKEHRYLVILTVTVFTLLPSLLRANVPFNYITWFSVLYFIAAYIRLYPRALFDNTKLYGYLSIITLILSWSSVVSINYLCKFLGKASLAGYFFVSDSNKILALATSLAVFMFFKNLKLGHSTFINAIAASSFGVLLIHANSAAMCQWLWKDTLRNVDFYSSPYLIVHAIGSVLVIYIVCTIIDWLRIKYLEQHYLKFIYKLLKI